ncbi:hypothetical protein PILCRDRAFT_819705 [Piloderma croceum F 1598]|uniref:Uncharacterized protein n=1 Tax=Piloderma croceum (strain F 1598) TaxID=765440 RepID=A0A0C3FVG2_PILCF|nr:hypothetical protein PILCRDRAFT_819705 [Piloderma croceum F 1598]
MDNVPVYIEEPEGARKSRGDLRPAKSYSNSQPKIESPARRREGIGWHGHTKVRGELRV